MGLALFGVGGIAGLTAGFGADPLDAPELSPAGIVAMRFPPAAASSVDAQGDTQSDPPSDPRSEPMPVEAAGYVLASADDQELASLIFNPNPVYPQLRQPAASTALNRTDGSPSAAPRGVQTPVAPAAAPVVAQLPPQLANVEPELPAMALAYAADDASERPAPAPQATDATPAKKAPHRASASNTVLNGAQIASIKERLKLSTYQTTLWPPVETALRDVSYESGHDTGHKTAANPRGGTIDPNSAPVQRLKSAAFPLLMSLNEAQKQEVRSMVRLMGLESLASQF